MNVSYSEIEFDPNPEDENGMGYFMTMFSDMEIGIKTSEMDDYLKLPESVLRAMVRHLDDLYVPVTPLAEEVNG